MPRHRHRRHLVSNIPPGHRPYQEQNVDYSLGPTNLVTSLPDIGHLAKWSVSSHKFGFGAECLRDDDPETFWQCVPFDCTHVIPRYHWCFIAPMDLNLILSLYNSGKRLRFRQA